MKKLYIQYLGNCSRSGKRLSLALEIICFNVLLLHTAHQFSIWMHFLKELVFKIFFTSKNFKMGLWLRWLGASPRWTMNVIKWPGASHSVLVWIDSRGYYKDQVGKRRVMHTLSSLEGKVKVKGSPWQFVQSCPTLQASAHLCFQPIELAFLSEDNLPYSHGQRD